MLIPETLGLKVLLVDGVVKVLENVLESTVVCLKDGVLGRHVQRDVLFECHLERRVGETSDRLGGVVHGETRSTTLGVVEHLPLLTLRAVGRRKLHSKLARLVDGKVLAAVLVTKRVTTDDDGLGPTGNRAREVVQDDGRTEHGTAKNVSDGAVRREPHLLEAKLLDTSLVGCDGSALDTHLVLFDGLGSLDGDLVVGSITVLHTEVVVLELDIQEGKNEVLANLVPDDTRHLVTVELNDRVGDLDLGWRGQTTWTNDGHGGRADAKGGHAKVEIRMKTSVKEKRWPGGR